MCISVWEKWAGKEYLLIRGVFFLQRLAEFCILLYSLIDTETFAYHTSRRYTERKDTSLYIKVPELCRRNC